MLKQHKNAFFEAIQKAGLEPAKFRSEESQNQDASVFTIKFRNAPFTFIVEQDPSNFDLFRYKFTEFKPGWPDSGCKGTAFVDGGQFFPGRPDVPNSPIIDVLSSFRIWLHDVVRRYLDEMSLPDLWSQVGIYGLVEIKDVLPADDTVRFSQAEKKQVRIALQEFKRLLSENFQMSQA